MASGSILGRDSLQLTLPDDVTPRTPGTGSFSHEENAESVDHVLAKYANDCMQVMSPNLDSVLDTSTSKGGSPGHVSGLRHKQYKNIV